MAFSMLRSSFGFLLLSACLHAADRTLIAAAPATREAGDNVLADRALGYLAREMDRYHESVIVYDEYSSGGARFYPSGFMGDIEDLLVEEDCTARPHSGLSCTRIQYSGKHSRGERWAGIYWLWPDKNWGAHAGRDLKGATRLTFWARGAKGGEQVECKVGGVNRSPYHDSSLRYEDSFGPEATGWLRLSADWQEFSVDLHGQDLSNVIGGFCVTFNEPHSPDCSIYLDDASFELTQPARLALLNQPRFIRSYVPASPVADRAFINAAYTYDNALAILAFLARGRQDDVRRAGLLCDALVFAQNHDRDFKDGRLRNAYQCGETTDENGNARLPGWWDARQGKFLEDAYCVGSHCGNQAWCVIALVTYATYTEAQGRKATAYIDAAVRLGDWIQEHCYSDTGPGGYTGGVEGWPTTSQGQTRLAWKSTEMNLDCVSAFRWLARLTGDPKWNQRAEHARRFVEAMIDPSSSAIFTGTGEDGVTINRKTPLDCATWAVLALGEPQRYAAALAYADSKMRVQRCPKGCPLSGYDFDTDRDGVWLEGTAQMALAKAILGNRDGSLELLTNLEAAQKLAEPVAPGALMAACHDGLTTGFDKSWGKWVYFKRPHVGASAWAVCAGLGDNPYQVLASHASSRPAKTAE